MTKKEQKKALVEVLREGMVTPKAYQDRPWTFVVFEVMYYGGNNEKLQALETFGFSKVCRPDKWDEQYGIDLAVDKALHKLAKKLMNEENND